MQAGLVSITYRKLSPTEIVTLAARAGLAGIEWGGDVHVPHGDLDRARAVRRLTEDAGLAVASYGSYYRANHPESGSFAQVLETALVLGAPVVRVWAGNAGSASAGAAYFDAVTGDLRQCAALAEQAGIAVACEYHRGTLTDTLESADRLRRAVAHPNLRGYWQAPLGSTRAENLHALDTLAPWLSYLHVFTWVPAPENPNTARRLPLADGEADWPAYLARAWALARPAYALIEFVRDDDPAQLLPDATALRRWLATLA